MTDHFEIDGSILEGGGQILRISISLSAILGVPVKVTNIRAGRKKPGLAAQHLKGIELVAQMCQAKLNGAQIGSTEIEFSPGKIRGGHYIADTKTAGSISLLLQVALPCALMADSPVTLELMGGTNADMAPQIDFMSDVFRHTLNKFGADFTLNIRRRGYYPKGGGHVTVDIDPVKKLTPITLMDIGNITSIGGKSYVAGVLPIKMAYLMSQGASRPLETYCGNIVIESYKETNQMASDNCSGIVLNCVTSSGCVLGSDGLGRRGVDAKEVGKVAGEELKALIDNGACVDNHVQDQIIIYMALADGTSTVRTGEVTLHTQTAIYVAEKIAKTKFKVQQRAANDNVIECTGIALINKNIPD